MTTISGIHPEMRGFIHTPFCRAIAKILIFLMAIYAFPLWEVSARYEINPDEFSRMFGCLPRFWSPGEAEASPPVANAGADQPLVKNEPLGGSAILNGTGSYDPDGDPLIYQWYGPFAPTSGPTPQVQVPEGVYSVSLVVDDGTSYSDVDTTIVTISPCFISSPMSILRFAQTRASASPDGIAKEVQVRVAIGGIHSVAVCRLICSIEAHQRESIEVDVVHRDPLEGDGTWHLVRGSLTDDGGFVAIDVAGGEVEAITTEH